MPVPDNRISKIKEIFTEAQYSIASHNNLLSRLKKLYDTCPVEVFYETFSNFMKVPLAHAEKTPAVERTLDFAVKFSVSLLSKKPSQNEERSEDAEEDEDEDEMPKFLIDVLKFMCENVGVGIPTVRFRICQFINKLLNNLGNEACIDDDVCDLLRDSLLERMKDASPVVRAQAVRALYRLQDPNDPDCLVTKTFLFHLPVDTSSDVRGTILTNIALSTASVRAILERTRDVNETVRKLAFLRLADTSIQRFSIDQRVRLLERGLKDVEKVRKCVATDLLRSWTDFYKGNLTVFLHALDSEHSTKIATLALQTLFKTHKTMLTNAIEQLTSIQGQDKLIPVEQLTPENVLLLTVVTQYLDAHPEIADERPIDEPLPELLPELSTFCMYIKRFFDRPTAEEEAWMLLQKQYIIEQLLEICKGFDFADEMGRAQLRALCQELLNSDRVTDRVVPYLVDLLVKVIPDVDDRLQSLAEVISELRDPLAETEDAAEPAQPEVPIPQLSDEEKRQLEIKGAKIRMKLNELTEEQDEAAKSKNFRRAQELQEECQALRDELAALKTQSVAVVPVAVATTSRPATQEARNDEAIFKDKNKLRKCLSIVREMMQSPTVQTLTPTLRSLMHNFVMPCLEHVNESEIRNKALEVMGIFCLLDEDLAKQHFVYMFCFQIANDEVCETALKVTFDLLHQYGLETFEVEQENKESGDTRKKRKKKNLFVTETLEDEFEDDEGTQNQTMNTSKANSANLISMLTSLLNSTSTAMRNTAMEGLCKLLLACRMTSPALLSRLILMWYSPVTDGDEGFRQPMAAFLKALSTLCVRGQEMLEQAFIPTLRTLREAPADSPLSQVEPESVARLFISFTRPGINRYHKKQSAHIHNLMAVSLCNEILNQEEGVYFDDGVNLKSLLQLELCLDDPVFRQDLITLTKSIKELLRVRQEKALLRSLERFIKILEDAAPVEPLAVPEVDNTARTEQLDNTNLKQQDITDPSLTTTITKKHKNNAKILRNGNQTDDSDDDNLADNSMDATVGRVRDDVVIPESPGSPTAALDDSAHDRTNGFEEEQNSRGPKRPRMSTNKKTPLTAKKTAPARMASASKANDTPAAMANKRTRGKDTAASSVKDKRAPSEDGTPVSLEKVTRARGRAQANESPSTPTKRSRGTSEKEASEKEVPASPRKGTRGKNENEKQSPSKEVPATPSKRARGASDNEAPSPRKGTRGTNENEAPATPTKRARGTNEKEASSKEAPASPRKGTRGASEKEAQASPRRSTRGTSETETPATPTKRTRGTNDEEASSKEASASPKKGTRGASEKEAPAKELPATPKKDTRAMQEEDAPASPVIRTRTARNKNTSDSPAKNKQTSINDTPKSPNKNTEKGAPAKDAVAALKKDTRALRGKDVPASPKKKAPAEKDTPASSGKAQSSSSSDIEEAVLAGSAGQSRSKESAPVVEETRGKRAAELATVSQESRASRKRADGTPEPTESRPSKKRLSAKRTNEEAELSSSESPVKARREETGRGKDSRKSSEATVPSSSEGETRPLRPRREVKFTAKAKAYMENRSKTATTRDRSHSPASSTASPTLKRRALPTDSVRSPLRSGRSSKKTPQAVSSDSESISSAEKLSSSSKRTPQVMSSGLEPLSSSEKSKKSVVSPVLTRKSRQSSSSTLDASKDPASELSTPPANNKTKTVSAEKPSRAGKSAVVEVSPSKTFESLKTPSPVRKSKDTSGKEVSSAKVSREGSASSSDVSARRSTRGTIISELSSPGVSNARKVIVDSIRKSVQSPVYSPSASTFSGRSSRSKASQDSPSVKSCQTSSSGSSSARATKGSSSAISSPSISSPANSSPAVQARMNSMASSGKEIPRAAAETASSVNKKTGKDTSGMKTASGKVRTPRDSLSRLSGGSSSSTSRSTRSSDMPNKLRSRKRL